jgi:AcrR family transcriptional regulator
MPRPDQSDARRKRLLPLVCRAFAELGYRRATTAELARRCRVRENILYRLWPDKKAMFLAAIDDIYRRRADQWAALSAGTTGGIQAVARLIEYEAKHQGEFGFHRVIFTALAEADDPAIRAVLVDTYRRFQHMVRRQIENDRPARKKRLGLSADDAAWTLVGLATVSNVIRELDLLTDRKRTALFTRAARALVSSIA